MSDIFLSYASEDRERVRPLAETLAAEGWTVFWDRKIPVGKTWEQMLEEELAAARSLVVVWSKNSIRSDWVKEEANEAKRRKLPIFPILLDGVLPPLGFRAIQGADFSDWDGNQTSLLLQSLIQDIKVVLPLPATPQAELEPGAMEAVKKIFQKPITVAKPLTADELMELVDSEKKGKEQAEPGAAASQEVKATEPEPLGAQPEVPSRPIMPGRKKTLFLFIGATLGLAAILLTGWWLFTSSNKTPITNTVGMTFVLIPAGSFQMGSPPGEEGRYDDERQHQVTISRPFYLQTTEVTQGQWEKVMGSTPSYFKTCGQDCPVESVSWNDAQEFIKKLNRMENTDTYRLPTEAEWEYACRAGSNSRFYFGDDESQLKDYAWYDKNSAATPHPVGQLKPNALGLYDMHGNVWEWCQDWYAAYPTKPVTDPQGPEKGENRVLRGGSWGNNSRYLRSAVRFPRYPDHRFNDIGFRVARTY